jgi:HAD superfamily hydrolase (TIGR01549 family)
MLPSNGKRVPVNGHVGRVRGVVFDLDGTLIVDQHDYAAIRRELGLTASEPLLEWVERLEGAQRDTARRVLHRHEEVAARAARVNAGVPAFLARLDAQGIRRGVLTRNTRSAASTALAVCGLSFDAVVTRDDGPHKPDPFGIVHLCAAWDLAPGEVLMLGDYLYDLQAGRAAGARTALVTHGRDLPFANLADLSFASFEAVPEALGRWIGDVV